MSDLALRNQLENTLRGVGAHVDFVDAVADLPAAMRGAKLANFPHTPWQLVEHLRICQWDILEFSQDPNHVSPSFPDGLWPSEDAPPNSQAWDQTVQAFLDDREELIQRVLDPRHDLFAPIPHGDGQTLLREALLAADHNAYHVGQLIVLRRALGAWPAE